MTNGTAELTQFYVKLREDMWLTCLPDATLISTELQNASELPRLIAVRTYIIKKMS